MSNLNNFLQANENIIIFNHQQNEIIYFFLYKLFQINKQLLLII